MKSREGTVVDADDLMDEMVATAKGVSEELGKAKDLSPEDADKLYQDYLNLGAKYKRGQEVWVFDSDYMFIRAEVTRVAYQSVGGVTWYQLYVPSR